MSSPVPSKSSSKDAARQGYGQVEERENSDSNSSSSSSSSSSSDDDDEYDQHDDGPAGVPDTEYLGAEYILFNKMFSVQFHVDSAIGLPVSSTATRVSAILITPDRKQVGDATLSSFSQPASDYMSPKFDLHMSWRKSELLPTVTILCRIDTLENPTLYPRCVGYAACKLCIDENGLQVNDTTLSHSTDNIMGGTMTSNADANSSSSRGTSNDTNHLVYVNSGHFLLPIVYGSVSELSTLTVAAVEAMPHIAGAFLSVKLRADSNSLDSVSRYMMRASSETGTENTEDALASVSSTNYHSQYSILNPMCVTKVLVETFSNRSNTSLTKLPMSNALLSDILKNQKIYSGEKMMMHTYMKEWIRGSFPSNIASITQFINFKTMFAYHDDVGALVALDMLHNMPARSNLIRAASESAAVQAMSTGLSKGWDGKISFFKTVFKYLPGDPVKAAELKRQQHEVLQQKAAEAQQQLQLKQESNSSNKNNSKGSNSESKKDEEPARLVDALASTSASAAGGAAGTLGASSTATTAAGGGGGGGLALEVKLVLAGDAPDSATDKASPHPEDATVAAPSASTSAAAAEKKEGSVMSLLALSVVTKAVTSALNNVGAMASISPHNPTGGTTFSILSRHSSSSSEVSSTADLTTPLPNIVSSPPKSLQYKPSGSSMGIASGGGSAAMASGVPSSSGGINSRRSSRGSNLAVVLENVPQINPSVGNSNNNIRRRSLRNGELPGDIMLSTNDITNALQNSGAGVSVSNNKNLRRRSMDNSAMAGGVIRRRSLTNGNSAASLALTLGTATAITVSGGVTPAVNSGKDTLKPLPSDLNGSGVLRRRSIGGASHFSHQAINTPSSILDMTVQSSPKPKPKSAFNDTSAEGSPVKNSSGGGLLAGITRRRSVGSVPTSSSAGLVPGLQLELKKPTPSSSSSGWTSDTSGGGSGSGVSSSNPISTVVSTLRRRSLGGGNSVVPTLSDPAANGHDVGNDTPSAPIDLLSPAPNGHHKKSHHHHHRSSGDNASVESGQSGSINSGGDGGASASGSGTRRRSLNNIRRRSLNNNLNYNAMTASESNTSQYKYLNSPLPPISRKQQPTSLIEDTIVENSNSGSSEEDSIKNQPSRLLSPAPVRPFSKSELITNAIDTFATNIRRNSLGKDGIQLPEGFGAGSTNASGNSNPFGGGDVGVDENEDDIYDFGGMPSGYLSPSMPSSSNKTNNNNGNNGNNGNGGVGGGGGVILTLTSDNIKRNSMIEHSQSNSAKLQSTLTAFNQSIRRNSSGAGTAAAAALAAAANSSASGGGMGPGLLTKGRSSSDLVSDRVSNHSKTSKGSARKYIYHGGRTSKMPPEIRNNSIFNINNEYNDPDTSGLLGGGGLGGVGTGGGGGAMNNPYGRRGSQSSLNSYVSDFSAQKAAPGGKVTIIDDASLDLDLETSTEQFPVYLDEYSSTAGLGMSKCGAVLIVVTAVDILTANASTNISVPSAAGAEEQPDYLINAHHVPFSPQHSFSSLQSDFSFLYRNAKHIKAEKLQGLVGIFIGHHDASSTWWGLLPLQVDSPFHSYVLALSGENTPNLAAPLTPTAAPASELQQQQLSVHNDVTVTALGVVNSGTHQIPLFAGVPPKEMEEAPDPMEWVLQTMKAQNEMRAEHERKKKAAGGLVGGLCSSLSEVMSGLSGSPQMPKRSKKLKIKDELKLSDGASAIVRVVDARLLRFGCDPIAVNPLKSINISYLESILKTSVLSNKESSALPSTNGVAALSVGSTASSVFSESNSINSAMITSPSNSGRIPEFLMPKSANRLIRSMSSSTPGGVIGGGSSRGTIRSSSLWSKHNTRQLLKKFQYSTAVTRQSLVRNAQLNRNIKAVIPTLTDPDTLMSEVNQKFTLTLSDD